MHSPSNQCLLKNSDLFDEGHWLFVNPDEPSIFNKLGDNVEGFHQYFDVFEKAQTTASQPQHFGFTYGGSKTYDGAVIYVSKAKQHTALLVEYVATLLNPNGKLLIVGENKSGIKSSAKLLEIFGTKASKIDSARHCTIFGTSLIEKAPSLDLDSRVRWYEVSMKAASFHVASIPGVFSHNELDEGTKMLLENVSDVPNGDILDFACGAGVIASHLGKLNANIKLTLSDVNASALYCAEQTLKRNDLEGNIIASNGLSKLNQSFNAIYTNPPFHTGLKTDYQITQRFIKDAARLLKPGGELVLVANSFLPYKTHLEEEFESAYILCENKKYTLYKCIKH